MTPAKRSLKSLSCSSCSSWLFSVVALTCAACGPIETRNTVIIEQPKPLEVNVNLTGRLELVITDARKDLEQITGEKPRRQVRPEDIGLPADLTGSSIAEPQPIALLSDIGLRPNDIIFAAATSEDTLVASMAQRNAQVRQLLSAKLVGEAHTGLLVARGTLNQQQSAVMSAENADRTALYQLRAEKNKTTVEKAALAYYLQRLGYAEKGDWVEIFNKQTKQWEWTQWSK
jgi:uncharacterized protein YdbL (DUF1318 family)